MVILDLEVLGTNSKNIVKRIKHQKDARRNSVQKDMLNSSPSFSLASFMKKRCFVKCHVPPILLLRGCVGILLDRIFFGKV